VPDINVYSSWAILEQVVAYNDIVVTYSARKSLAEWVDTFYGESSKSLPVAI